MVNLFSIRPKGFNIGNDVIYLGINHFIRLASEINYNIITIPATGKYEIQKKSGISSQTVHEINQFGDGVIIGGGNLYENNELEVNPIALKALEKPLMIFSVSRGKIYNNDLNLVDRTDVMPDEKISILNKKAIVSLSRDKSTTKYLNDLGLNTILGGCPTLFINEMPQHLVPLTKNDKTDALISIRTPNLMSIPVSYQYEVREQILSIIAQLNEYGYKRIKFLCHDIRDVAFAASFRNYEYIYTEDVYTYLSYLRNTKINITYRLHSCLPCLSYDIPCIKLSYDERGISMLDTLGLDDWNINILKTNVIEEVKMRLKNIQELEQLKNKQKESWFELREKMIKNTKFFLNKVVESHGHK